MSIDLDTFSCHTPDCPNEARSRVGRYSYCDHCRRGREASAQTQVQVLPATIVGFEAKVVALRDAAKVADRLRLAAKKATEKALAAKKTADDAAGEVQRLARELAA